MLNWLVSKKRQGTIVTRTRQEATALKTSQQQWEEGGASDDDNDAEASRPGAGAAGTP